MAEDTGGRRCTTVAPLLTLLTVLAMSGHPSEARAQAWNYPSFQQSHVVNREFGLDLADAGSDGVSFLLQWREQIEPFQQQFSVDVGLASPNRGSTIGFIGGTYAYQLVTQSTEQPIEMLGTAGGNFAFGSGTTVIRIPVGVSFGHRFPIPGGYAITPYVHPRLAVEFCNDCGTNGRGRSELGLGFGLGANFELNPQVALRIDTSFGFSSIAARDDAIGIGFAWSPMGLRKP